MGSIRRSKTKRRTRYACILLPIHFKAHEHAETSIKFMQISIPQSPYTSTNPPKPQKTSRGWASSIAFLAQSISRVNTIYSITHAERIIREGALRHVFLPAYSADAARLRLLKEEPYSQREAEAAAGIGAKSVDSEASQGKGSATAADMEIDAV